MKKIALVIGATGLIGKALVEKLLLRDDVAKVIALTRRPLIIDNSKFENHQIDFASMDKHQAHFENVDMLFSCLGTTKKQAGSIAKQRVVDLDYQYQAAKIGFQAGVSRYFLVSSSGAASSSLSPYLKMKGELEDRVLVLGFKRCVIFRPSLLLGDREEHRAGEFFAGKVMPLLAHVPLLKRYRPIQGSEVAAKMATVALESSGPQSRSNAAEFYNLDQVF